MLTKRFSRSWTLGAATAGLASVLSCSCHHSAPPQPPDNLPDTTSHNFAWQVTALGDGLSSSGLSDVAIINDTLAYAVGTIFLTDSTGQEDHLLYNYARWNGHDWFVGRLYYNYQGQAYLYDGTAVFAFGENDVWLFTGVLMHWNGYDFAEVDIPSSLISGFQAKKIWGSSSSDLYVVGLNGTILHYDGANWQKLTTGTILTVQDIWGSVNATTHETVILALASNKLLYPAVEVLLRIQGTSVNALTVSGLPLTMSGVWHDAGVAYYLVGDGIFYSTHPFDGAAWAQKNGITQYYTECIRGSAYNDIVAAGSSGELLHYNGSTWHSYRTEIQNSVELFLSIGMRDNLVIAVGIRPDFMAGIVIGRR